MKKIYKILSVMLLLCSLLFYVPKIQTSYAYDSITSNNVVYYSPTTETYVNKDIRYLNTRYDEETSKYVYQSPDWFCSDYTEANYSDPYMIDILEIAETNSNELFLYVYSPYKLNADNNSNNDIYFHFIPHAKSVNISITYGENLSFINYKLDYLNYDLYVNSNNFYYYILKYKVRDFVVSESSSRYYEFSTIYSDIMPSGEPVGEIENNQTIDEYGYPVKCKYLFTTNENGDVSVEKQDTEVITITNMFVGYARYKNTATPSWIDKNSCDRHFVAFNTNKRIDKLIEADVYFKRQSCRKILGQWSSTSFGDKIDDYAYLDYTQKTEIENQGNWFWGGYTYNWDRIQTVNAFKSSVDMTNVYTAAIFDVSNETKINADSEQALNQNQWVLSFYESDYDYSIIVGGMAASQTIEERTAVGEVSILRLYFETDGVRYNLGAVSNKQTGSDEPINTNNITVSLGGRVKDYWDIIKIILGILAVILIISLLGPFLPAIFGFIWLILKAVFNVIALPFKLISRHKKKDKRNGKR